MLMLLVPARAEHAELLLHCRNDPECLSLCGNAEPVTPEQHQRWLADILENRQSKCQWLYVAMVDGLCIGSARISEHPLDAWAMGAGCRVSYVVGKEYRGRGYGKELVAQTVAKAKELGYVTISARIKRHNMRSMVCAMVAGVNTVEFF